MCGLHTPKPALTFFCGAASSASFVVRKLKKNKNKMVCIDVMSTAGALLTVLVVKTRLAGAAFSAHHMRALATASTSTSDVVCVAEGQACGLDAECLACAEAYDAAFDSCIPSVTTGTCDELEDVMCCASSGCEDNAAYSTFLGAKRSRLTGRGIAMLFM